MLQEGRQWLLLLLLLLECGMAVLTVGALRWWWMRRQRHT
jgi:hypothetical protein